MWVEEVDVRHGQGRPIMEGLRRSFAVDMKARYPESDVDYGPETLPSGLTRDEGGAFLVLRDNDRAVGCVGLRRLPTNFAQNMDLTEHDFMSACEGKSLYIDSEFRGRFGAALLMHALVEVAIGYRYTTLYGNTGRNQPESLRVLSGLGKLRSEQIALYDPSNELATFAFRLDLTTSVTP